jgi:beta-lactamase regulating signal transducer with metallopeptidase domain
VLAAGYIAGSIIIAAYVSLGMVLLRRLASRSAPPPPWLEALFAERCRIAGVAGAGLRVTAAPCRPLSAGVLRPVVIVPVLLVDPRQAASLTRVLDHELIHVRRRDAAGRMLFAVAAPVLWLHPVFWWLRGRAALAAELVADDLAAGVNGRHEYARALVMLAGRLRSLRPAPGNAPAAFRTRSELTRRIHMLIAEHGGFASTSTRKARVTRTTVLTATVALCVATLGVHPSEGAARQTERSVRTTESARTTRITQRAQTTRVDQPTQSARVAEGKPVARAAEVQRIAPVAEPPARQDRGQRTDPQPDYEAVLALVDRALTLRGELELGEAMLAQTRRMAQTGQVSETEMLRAELEVRSLERRVAAVNILIETEIQATGLELEELTTQLDAGLAGAAAKVRQVRLAAKLKLLRSVM